LPRNAEVCAFLASYEERIEKMTEQGSDLVNGDIYIGNTTGDGDPTDNQEENLGEGVTKEPQDPEHMDLRGIENFNTWLESYLKVSDDAGEFLGDTGIEKQIRDLCNALKEKDLENEENPQMLLDQITELMKRYSPMVNKADNTTTGIITKYRIRQGTLLIAQKKLVKKLGKKWKEWFNTEYGGTLLRSAQDYMRIAEIPNSIQYAVFGKERLTQIIRQLEETESENPIGDFLRINGIQFHSSEEDDLEEFRTQTDLAVERAKLNKNGLEEVQDEQLEAFVRGGNRFKSQTLENMKYTKGAGGDLNQYMDLLITSSGSDEPELAPQFKAQSYSKSFKKFFTLTKSAIDDDAYLADIDQKTCKELKKMLLEIVRKLTPNPST
jgi:hypothetical protein